MVALRNLLRDDPPLSVIAVDRQKTPGGIWTGHIPAYSTLQDLKIEYQVHGVKFPQPKPARRAPRDQVAEFCRAYHDEFGLGEHVLWQHEVIHVEMVKPMLHKVEIKPCSEALTRSASFTVFTRSVLVCTYVSLSLSLKMDFAAHSTERGDNYYKHVATFPGQETATFPIKHNLDIREASEIPQSNVVIIGAGPSAMDMVQEACITRGATDVHLVTRSTHWYVWLTALLVGLSLLRIFNVRGAPDGWWPWMWQWHLGSNNFLKAI